MYYIEVAPIKLVRKDAMYFTYHYTEQLPVGCIVKIPIGKTECIGIVIKHINKPRFKTRPISKVIQPIPLPNELIKTAKWMSQYYNTHLAQCLALLLPAGLEKTRRTRQAHIHQNIRTLQNHPPTPEQAKAIKKITQSHYTTNILFGVTGSGKTSVYLAAIRRSFEQGFSSIVLVPEISLTPQIVDEFVQVFKNDVIITHSKQTEAERHQAWQAVLTATTPKIVIGPRSAMFLPLKNIKFIVVDEFHEPSYKQDKQPRYSSVRVATMLCKYHNAKLILGSATPSVVEMYIAKNTSSPVVKMTTPALGVAKPAIRVVDMTRRDNFLQHRFLSDELITTIEDSLRENKQVLLFHNRRGTAPITLCTSCGWLATEPASDIPLTLHADKHLLISHLTGYSQPVPTCCPICNTAKIIHKGIGTKLLEVELAQLYPKANIARFDSDSQKGEAVEDKYKDLCNGEIDIIIGTQTVAKGIDLPRLNTVGVVQADVNLSIPDYTSEERVFQLLSQVIGRVGRHSDDTKVIIQSYQPNHLVIKAGIKQDYTEFYNYTISQRKKNNLPPFSYLLKLTCSYKTETAAIKASHALLAKLKQASQRTSLSFYGPAPSFHERSGGAYRWQIIVKSPKRRELLEIIPHLPAKNWQYDIDPISLL